MRRLIPAAMAGLALLWATGAGAVVSSSDVQIVSGGQPVPGATVTFSVPEPPSARPTRPSATRVTHRPTATGRTSRTGHVRVRFETRDDPETRVSVTVRDEDGRVYVGTTTLARIAAGAPIEVQPQHAGGPPPSGPEGVMIGVGAGGQTSACNNVRTIGIVSITPDPIGENPETCMTTGFRGSVFVGYARRVAGNWLAGVEADIGLTNISKTVAGIPGTVNGMPNVTPAVAINDSVTLTREWDLSLRGRLGYFVTPAVVAYLTGGLALQSLEASLTCSALGACGINGLPAFTSAHSKVLTGWTLGGGLEAALTDRIVGRVEYRYADYESFTPVFRGPTTTAFTVDIDMRTHTLLVGIGVKLGGS